MCSRSSRCSRREHPRGPRGPYRLARVRAAFLAAAARPRLPFVRAALRAAAERCEADLRRAADFACRPSERADAAVCPSRRSALRTARERVVDGRPRLRAVLARLAAAPFRGSFTPARRAFDKPIAIACFVERAPCFPSRM